MFWHEYGCRYIIANAGRGYSRHQHESNGGLEVGERSWGLTKSARPRSGAARFFSRLLELSSRQLNAAVLCPPSLGFIVGYGGTLALSVSTDAVGSKSL